MTAAVLGDSSGKDPEQDKRLSVLETEVMLMKATAGTLKVGELAKLGGILSLLVAMGSGFSAMYLQTKTEPTRNDVALLQSDVRDLQEDIGVLSSASKTVKESSLAAAKETIVPLERDIARIAADIEKLADAQDDFGNALNDTLDQEVLEQRFDAIEVQINAVEGRFDRITNNRLQPLIDKLDDRLSTQEKFTIEELKRARDLSPITADEQ